MNSQGSVKSLIRRVWSIKLYDDWKVLLRHAWSIRFILLAGFLTGCEAVVQIIGVDGLPIPQWAKSLVVFVVIALAFWARLVKQPNTLDKHD